MSSPIVNLKKTNMAPEKVINGSSGTQIKNQPRSIEEDINDIRRNSANGTDKEKIILQMSKRMSILENLMKDVKEELSKTVEVISRKDDEIEMLKEQLYERGRRQTSQRLSPAQQTAQEDEYLKEQFDKLNEVISSLEPKKERIFYRKGGIISTEDGNTEDRRKHCKQSSSHRTMPPKNYSLNEETGDSFSINRQYSRNKSKVYKDDVKEIVDEKILAESGDEYPGNFSDSESVFNERSIEDLETAYLELADQVSQMEKFLTDYGMIWVGEQKIKDEDGDRIIQTTIGFTPDFNKVILIINTLNELISSENHVRVSGNKAKFQKSDVLKLDLYADGIQLEDGPFRKYSTDSVKAFFHDLEDGYFPAELKESHPDGVIFKINDKRSVKHGEAKKQEAKFSGPGYRLGTLQSSDEEPDAKERRSKKRTTKIDLKSEVDSQESSFKIELMKETPDDQPISDSQKHDDEDDYVLVDENRHDASRNVSYDNADSDRPASSKLEYVANEKLETTPFEPEFVKSFESKVTQTEMNQETQTVRSLEMQSNADRQRPIYRDIIDITNITYYEAPSVNPGLTRHVMIGPTESQSEPAMGATPTIPFQRNSQGESRSFYQQQEYRKHPRGERYPQRINQDAEMDFDSISEGSGGSGNQNPFGNTLYNDSYGQNVSAVTAMLAEKKYKKPVTELFQSNSEDEKTQRSSKAESRKSKESTKSESEPKLTQLNKRISDGQIELTLKSYDGKETYCAHVYPDDTIGKVWLLTNLNADEFEVTADDKVLDLNVPLKNYNIDGDVTLNIVKRKSSQIHNPNILPDTNETNEDGSIDSQDEDDAPPEISKPDDDEEGYSS